MRKFNIYHLRIIVLLFVFCVLLYADKICPKCGRKYPDEYNYCTNPACYDTLKNEATKLVSQKKMGTGKKTQKSSHVKSKVAFFSDRTGKYGVYLMDEDGSNLFRVTSLNLDDDMGCDYSSVLKKVIFSANISGNYELYLINADGSNLTRLTYTDAHNCDPSFSPDGKKAVFVSTRDRNWEIYEVEISTGQPTRLTNTKYHEWSPRYSHDGKKIIFTRFVNDYEIYTMDRDGTNEEQITYNIAVDCDPEFSHDDKHIVFASNRMKTAEIYVYDLTKEEIGGEKRMTYTENAGEWNPRCLGKKIIFETERDGNCEIYSMNFDGSSPVNLTRNAATDAFGNSSFPDTNHLNPRLLPSEKKRQDEELREAKRKIDEAMKTLTGYDCSVVFIEEFSDNKNGWFTGTSNNKTCGIRDGVYSFEFTDKEKVGGVSIPIKEKINNYIIFAQIRLKKGNGEYYGFRLRDNHYGFYIRDRTKYSFNKWDSSGDWVSILDATTSSFIISEYNEWNNIVILCNRSTFKFYINGCHVKTAYDSEYSTGGPQLSVGSLNTVEFDNVLIFKINE